MFIPYGKTQLELRLPADADVTTLDPRDTAPAVNSEKAVIEALDSVDWGRLSGAKTAAIAINDKTRPVPHDLLLPPLLRKLEGIGIGPDRITFIIATGCHPPMQPEEFGTILPADIIERYRVISHNIEDEKNIIRLGMTKLKTIVSINRYYFTAHLKIVVGNVEPHQFVGFSGGVKSAVIGLAGWDTINGNHRMMTDPNAEIGRYDDNPVRQDIEEMGRIVGVNLAVNTLLNRQKQIVRVFAGPPIAVMRSAIPLVRQVYELPVERAFDVTIVSPGGHPKDINIYQSQKALGHASLVTKAGGAIIIAAACPEGSGSTKYENWVGKMQPVDSVNAHRAVIDRFTAEGFRVGPHKAYQIARDSVDRRVIWITDIPNPEHFLMETAPSLDEALARVGIEGKHIGVIPYANATIPTLADDAHRPKQ